MAALSPLHDIHEITPAAIPAPILVAFGRQPSAVPPQVAVINIVIIDLNHRRSVSRQLSERPDPQVPLVEVIERGRETAVPARRVAFVKLIPGEDQQVRGVATQVFDQPAMGKVEVLLRISSQ